MKNTTIQKVEVSSICYVFEKSMILMITLSDRKYSKKKYIVTLQFKTTVLYFTLF